MTSTTINDRKPLLSPRGIREQVVFWTITGVVLFLVAAFWLLSVHRRATAIREISQAGGTVTSDQGGVLLNSPKFGDDDLRRLAPSLDAILNLNILVLSGTRITDASVPYLKKLHDEQKVIICFDNTAISEAGRCQIEGVPISEEDAKRLLQMNPKDIPSELKRLSEKHLQEAKERKGGHR